jgi:hypothetical protein
MSIQREYIVTLHNFEDLENFYNDMENPGGSLCIPSRVVPVHLRRSISCNTHYYLTAQEAETLKNDPRVLDVSLPLEDLNIVAQPQYTQTSNNWSRSGSTTSNLEKNWGLLRCFEGVQRPGWGTSFQNASGTIDIPYSGQHVDIVIVDGLFDWTHPEFTTNSNGTGPTRVIRYNWFNDNPALGFGAAGTYSYSSSTLLNINHGIHVAGIAAGNSQGWARGANIYNIGPYEENGVPSNRLIDYIRYWHNNKPINSVTGRKNPTIVNCSFGYVITVAISAILSVNYQGTTYTGPFTAGTLNSYEIHTEGTDAKILVPVTSVESDIAQAINDGIIFVGAAGNYGIRITRNAADSFYNNSITDSFGSVYTQRGSLAAADNVICVGMTSAGADESKFPFSVTGPRIDVYAPGHNIMSAYQSGSIYDPRSISYRIGKLSGTSMASPQVAGLLACILEPLPDLTVEQAISYIHNTGKSNQITDYPGSGNYYSQDLLGSPNRFLYAETDVVATLTTTQTTYGLLINQLATPFTPIVPVGGLSPFTFSISPLLPAGLAFNTGTGSISGTPSVLLTSTEYTILVTDSINYTTDQTFNLVVANELVAVQSIPTRNLIITNQPIDPFTPVTFTGGYGNKTISISPSLPAGLTINSLTGSISGIPTESISNITYTVTITDEIEQTSSETFVFSLVVYKQSFTLTEETYINQPIQDLTSGTTYKVISGKIPPALTLTSNGYLLGTVDPVLNTLNYKFVVRATSNSGTISDKTFSIDVEGSDSPIWSTSSTNYLNVGPFGEPWALNYQYVNFKFNANAPGFSPAPKKVAIFGDSVSTYGGLLLTPGADPTIEASYIPSQIGSILSTIKNLYLPTYEIINISRGGMTTDEALTGVQNYVGPGLSNPFGSSVTITQWIIDNSPDKIILRYGLADAILINNSATTLNNLQTIINFAVNRGIEVILIGVNPAAGDGDPANSGYFPGYMTSVKELTADAINNGIINKATSQKLKYANPRTLIKPTNSLPDGIHPFLNFGQLITNEISNQLKKQIPENEQNLPQRYSDLPTPYKLRYFIKDKNGTLPPGLKLSDDGTLSGFLEDTLVFDGDENNQGYDTNRYDIFSYDFGVGTNSIDKTPIPKIYTFTITVSDGIKESNSTFGILVVNPEIIRSTSSNLLSVPPSVFVTNTNYVPPIQFIDKNDLGEIRSATSQILNTQGYDPYPLLGTVTYSLSTTTDILTQLPNYLSLDPTTGYISGFVPYQPAYTKNYTLTINATKTYNSSTVTTIKTFDLVVKGLVESSIEWVTSSTLPNLLAGELSEISFNAKELTNDYRVKYLLKNGSFPEGLTLGQDGSLFGRASTSTIGTTFTATVIASDVYNLSSIEKTFTLTVDDPETEYTQIYIRPFLHPTKRSNYQEFVNNEDIFPKNYLYRFYDPNFGIQQEIKMFLEFGIEKLNIDDYVDALYENFYRKTLYFGDIKIAVANDLNNDPLYELVYVDVVDTLINNSGVSISPVIYDGNEILYPNSIPNMKNSLRSIVLPDYSLIKTNDRYLPRFMKTSQPSTSQVTGFINVIPICYALPGNGKKIISRINASNFDFKQFNFTVDRIILENSLDSNTAKYLIFGRQEITDDLSVDNLLRGSDGIILQTETFDSLER